MYGHESSAMTDTRLKTFEHNRYFYGQLLDVHHFEREQSYFKEKIWLANRLVSGHGVICGLDVQLADDRRSIVVLPGVALDKAGREIVVPVRSVPVALHDAAPQPDQHQHKAEGCECETGTHVQVCLCFHQCESDPAPVLSGDCEAERCSPSAIRERYKIVIKEGKAPCPDPTCTADVVSGGRINYCALAIWVTRGCPPLPDDLCIPLANVRLPQPGGACDANDIDITVRPIVYTNDLLFELILCLMSEGQNRTRAGKH